MFTKKDATVETLKNLVRYRDDEIAEKNRVIARLKHEHTLADEKAAHQYKLLLEAEKAKLVKSHTDELVGLRTAHRLELEGLHDDYKGQINDLKDLIAEQAREIAEAALNADRRIVDVEEKYREKLYSLQTSQVGQLDEVRRTYIKRENEVQVGWSDKLETSRERHMDQLVALASLFGEKLPDVKVDLAKLQGDSTVTNTIEV